MNSPFENPKEVNPFGSIKPMTLPIPPKPDVIVVEKIITKDDRNRWLELPGACCVSALCGPCYMLAHLCCLICK